MFLRITRGCRNMATTSPTGTSGGNSSACRGFTRANTDLFCSRSNCAGDSPLLCSGFSFAIGLTNSIRLFIFLGNIYHTHFLAAGYRCNYYLRCRRDYLDCCSESLVTRFSHDSHYGQPGSCIRPSDFSLDINDFDISPCCL